MRYLLSFLFCLSFSFLPLFGFSQGVKDLQNRKSGILNELTLTQDLIRKSDNDKEVSLNKLLLLRSQMATRKKLIDNLNEEIEALNVDIVSGELNLSSLNQQLNDLKVAYSGLINAAYKTRYNQQKLLFIFSAKDFNQAYQRMRYFKEFSDLIERKGQDIIETSKQMGNQLNLIKQHRAELAAAIGSKKNEIETLKSEEQGVTALIGELKKKSQQLREDQKRLTQESLRIEKAIEGLLAEERKKSSVGGKIIYSSDALRLSTKFEDNRGKFPVPIENGIIVEGFGEHNHPVLKDVKIKSNGVKISSSTSNIVFSIYDGEVKKVISILGSNNAVIVRHGKYLTVYHNLLQVYVKPGDHISLGQSIGNLRNGSFLEFEIWKENQPLDPELWLRR
ncbi:MAG TPA: peptidoglycan DD-metalloendopeptidase family protein [Williamwhitmania sp.]|nr:peptidoglycan DD-metalloendopeptidase family protein [Williamwhitmania sp.]